MEKFAKRISEKDNVVTVVADCDAGDEVTVRFKNEETKYKCNQEVPFGHKIATVDIPKGAAVVKYGETIGSASQGIKKGDWVHNHNVKDDYICIDKDGKPMPGQD